MYPLSLGSKPVPDIVITPPEVFGVASIEVGDAVIFPACGFVLYEFEDVEDVEDVERLEPDRLEVSELVGK
jgi:hypothetical protein